MEKLSGQDADWGPSYLVAAGGRRSDGILIDGGFRYWRQAGSRDGTLGMLFAHVQGAIGKSRVRPLLGARIGLGYYNLENSDGPEGASEMSGELGIELGHRSVAAQLRGNMTRVSVSDGGWTIGLSLALTRREVPTGGR